MINDIPWRIVALFGYLLFDFCFGGLLLGVFDRHAATGNNRPVYIYPGIHCCLCHRVGNVLKLCL